MKSDRHYGWMVGAAGIAASAIFAAALVTQAMAGEDATRESDNPVAANLDGVQQVLASLREAGYTRVLEIEHEGDGFEVEALDADGREVDLLVDADGTLRRIGERDEDRNDD